MTTGHPDLSVVIPVRNGGLDLQRQLDSLESQDFQGSWEVIIADNGSTDNTLEVATSYLDRLPGLQIVDASTALGQAVAINAGAAVARGRSLILLDADDLVAPGYLSAMADALGPNPFVAARMDCESLNAPWVQQSRPPTQTDGIGAPFGFLASAAGCSLGIWKTTFDEVGGFDESVNLGTDVNFCWRVQLSGRRIAFVHDAVVGYRYRDDLKGIFRQARSYGTAGPALYRRYRSIGMRRRSWRTALRFHVAALVNVARIRSKADLAAATFLVGFRVGVVEGSLKNRVLYL